MKITFEPGRGTFPLFFEHDGRKWVQFIKLGNFPVVIELPPGAKLVEYRKANG